MCITRKITGILDPQFNIIGTKETCFKMRYHINVIHYYIWDNNYDNNYLHIQNKKCGKFEQVIMGKKKKLESAHN